MSADPDKPRDSTVFQSTPFGKYVLLRKLGKGGMGRVYEGLDTVLNRRVAVKLMAPADPFPIEGPGVDEERFLREAQVSASLAKHPHIVSVYEAGVIEGKRFLAMEYIDGRQLEEWRRGKPLREQLSLLRDVALAVHHANQNGVVHRDLKPANVIVDAGGLPHVTDFGLAKSSGPEFSRSITTSGVVVGTPAYMSPEQAQGLRQVDARSDVYSLGVMLFEMLAERHPFEAETAMQLLVKVVEHAPPKPSSLAGAPVDPRLETLCLKALSKRPEGRPTSARLFADELSRWLTEAGDSGPPRKRPRALVAIAAALLIAAVVAAILFLRSPSEGWADLQRRRPVLEGHPGKALALAFSPKDLVLASGGTDGRVRLWDGRTGELRASLGPHAGKVEALAWSPDGARLVSVTEDGGRGEAKLWELATGLLLRELSGTDQALNAVAFSPEGRFIVAGGRDGSLLFWEASTGGALPKIDRAHDAPIRALAFTPDGRSLVSGSWDHRAKVWDPEARTLRRTLSGHSEGIWALALSPDGRMLATASSDRTLKVWDLESGLMHWSTPAHEKEVSALAWSPNGRVIATGGWDRRVRLWAPRSGPLSSFEGHEDAVWGAAFSPDGRVLATAGLDGRLRLWPMPN